MKAEIEKVVLPEEEELLAKQKELDSLSDILTAKELELNDLVYELNRFNQQYYSLIQFRYQKLDDIKAQIAELKACRSPDNRDLHREAQEARKQAEETKREYENFTNTSPADISPEPPSEELKSLYRQTAKTIHPDKAFNDQDRLLRERHMKEANSAYEGGDIDKLRAILSEYQSSPESVKGEGAGADLIRTIRIIAKVKDRIAEIDNQIAEIKSEQMFNLMLKVRKAEEEGKNYFETIAKKIDKDIEKYQEELDELLAEEV